MTNYRYSPTEGAYLPNVAVYGRTGSGKSAVAHCLAQKHGYIVRRTGAACREITERLFGGQDKTTLNLVNDAMRAIEPNVWLRVALEEAKSSDLPIVIDGMRFKSNYDLLRSLSFVLIKVEASTEVRYRRLSARGQTFDPAVDETHPGELEIEAEQFDFVVINNTEGLQRVENNVNAIIDSVKHAQSPS